MNRTVAAVCLCAFAGLSVLLAWDWNRRNGFFARPYVHDQASYRTDAQRLRRVLREEGPLRFCAAAVSYEKDHPPVVPACTAALFAGRADVTAEQCFATEALFGLLLLAGTYGLGRRVGLGVGAATAATALCGALPIFSVQLRTYFTQLPMAALTVWSARFLVGSETFRRPGASYAFAACAGLATATKALAPIYFAGAYLVVAGAAFARGDRAARRRAAAVPFVAAAFAAPWFLTNGGRVFEYARWVVGSDGQRAFSRGVPMWSADRWSYYALNFVNNGTGPLTAAVVLLAVVVAIALRRPRAAAAADGAVPQASPASPPLSPSPGVLCAASAALAYPVLTVGQIENGAFYLLPFMPCFAIGAARTVARLPRRPRAIAAAALALAATFHLAAAQRGFLDDKPAMVVGPFETVSSYERLFSFAAERVGARPDAAGEPWPNAELARSLVAASPNDRPRVLHTTHLHPYVHPMTVEYECERQFATTPHIVDAALLAGGPEALLAEVRTLDFVVLHEYDPLPTVEQMRALSALAGREPQEVFAAATLGRTFRLFALRDGAPEGFVAAAEATASGVVAAACDPLDGFALKGWKALPSAGSRRRVATYWSAPVGAPFSTRAFQMRFADGTLSRVRRLRALPPALAGDAPVFAAVFSADGGEPVPAAVRTLPLDDHFPRRASAAPPTEWAPIR